MTQDFEAIEQSVYMPASPEEVYDALVDAEKHSEFTGSQATCDPRVGGAFSAWDGYISGRHLQLDRGKKIVQEWKTTEWPLDYPPSLLEFGLRERGEGTLLIMKHSKVPAEQADSYRQGWTEHYWEPLRQFFEEKMVRK